VQTSYCKLDRIEPTAGSRQLSAADTEDAAGAHASGLAVFILANLIFYDTRMPALRDVEPRPASHEE
jgi:hypothetical protein